MTPLELTAQAVRKLLADLEPEVEALDRLAEEVCQAEGPQPDEKADAAARAFLALKLHNYYTAAEKALERIVRVVDGVVPEGEFWHRELLNQAARSAHDLRPAILDQQVAGELDRLRSFRHFIRHGYAVELDWGELQSHRGRVETVHPLLSSRLSEAVKHLEATAEALEQMRGGGQDP